MKKFIYTICLLTGIVFTGCKKPEPSDILLNKIDIAFLNQASISNSAEVDVAVLAANKATNADVKKFAQHMILEHTKAQTDVKNLGSSVGVPLKDTIDPVHQAIKVTLSNLAPGRQFDSMYISSQLVDHDVSIANFKVEQINGLNTKVINYANANLPHLIMHRASADSITRAYFR